MVSSPFLATRSALRKSSSPLPPFPSAERNCVYSQADRTRRTRETFVDGWVHTGDEVMINEQMELFIVDRIKVSASSPRRSPAVCVSHGTNPSSSPTTHRTAGTS